MPEVTIRETHLIQEHTYPNGMRSRWYSLQSAAESALAQVPEGKRGIYTLSEPLRVGPFCECWRVDDNPGAQV